MTTEPLSEQGHEIYLRAAAESFKFARIVKHGS